MTKLTVWFDGDCPLCRREIALMRRLDRRRAIDFVDLGTGSDAACPLDRAEMLKRFHAREGDRIVSGAEAFAAMWRAVPALRPLGLVARNRFVLRLLEAAYRGFLRIRPRLQRLAPARSRANGRSSCGALIRRRCASRCIRARWIRLFPRPSQRPG